MIECRPNRGFRLKDVFLGEEVDVSERSGSQHARAGDIFYARVIRVDAVAMLAGCGSILIPPDYKPHLIRFRPVLHENRNTPITLGDLDDYDFELREIYFGIYDRLMTPPQIRNTDGDPLVLHRLHYEIDSADDFYDVFRPPFIGRLTNPSETQRRWTLMIHAKCRGSRPGF